MKTGYPCHCFMDHPYRELSETLLGHLRAANEPGLPGNRTLTDAWAKELDQEGWFEWKLFEVD